MQINKVLSQLTIITGFNTCCYVGREGGGEGVGLQENYCMLPGMGGDKSYEKLITNAICPLHQNLSKLLSSKASVYHIIMKVSWVRNGYFLSLKLWNIGGSNFQ